MSVAATAAFAQNQTAGFDGFVSAAVGTNKVSSSSISDSSNVNALRGTFAYTGESGAGLQLDNNIDNQTISNVGKFRSSDVALHGFYRSQDYLIGLMHQTRSFKINDTNFLYSGTLPIDRTFFGFEGQYHFDNITVYGQTVSDKVNVINSEIKGRTNALEARYFFDANLRTDLSYAESKFDDNNFSARVKTTSLGLEYKLSDSPFSFFGKYQNMNGDYLDTKRFLVGVNFNFGKGTLSDRNRSGASLNPIGADNILLNQLGTP